VLDLTGDKIASEIKELRKVLQDIRDLLAANNSRKPELQDSEVVISFDDSVFNSEYLLRSEKPI